MATYAHYRHVELDKVGCGKKRITKPPGGEASDIFGANSPTTTPPTTPRKVKNYLASNIFSAEQRHDPTPKSRQRPDDDSFKRLFGPGGKDAPDGGSPVRVQKNYQKSSILMNDNSESNGKAYTNGDKNGHASPNGHGSDSGMGSGSVTPNGGSSNGSTNGDAEPRTNGHANGHGNGHGNGHAHIEPGTPSRRMPPGGFSSIGNIFSP